MKKLIVSLNLIALGCASFAPLSAWREETNAGVKRQLPTTLADCIACLEQGNVNALLYALADHENGTYTITDPRGYGLTENTVLDLRERARRELQKQAGGSNSQGSSRLAFVKSKYFYVPAALGAAVITDYYTGGKGFGLVKSVCKKTGLSSVTRKAYDSVSGKGRKAFDYVKNSRVVNNRAANWVGNYAKGAFTRLTDSMVYGFFGGLVAKVSNLVSTNKNQSSGPTNANNNQSQDNNTPAPGTSGNDGKNNQGGTTQPNSAPESSGQEPSSDLTVGNSVLNLGQEWEENSQ